MGRCGNCGSEVTGAFCSVCGAQQNDVGPLRVLAGALFVELLEDGVIDPQLAREVMRSAAAEHGGRVETISSGAALAVFMAPYVKVDPALALVRTADSLRAELRSNPNIQWRAGASYGDCFLEDERDRTLLGLSVAGGARSAAAAAAPYQILLDRNSSDATARWCHTKPLASGMELFLDLNPEATGARDILGRHRELSTIRALFDKARRERSAQRVLLTADPGVGKTSLIEEFISGLGGSALAATGACPPQPLSPFGPIEDIVMQLADLDSKDPEGSLRDRLAEEPEGDAVTDNVAGLLGWADNPVGGAPYWGLRRLFEFIARFRTTVVILDDIHWADEVLLEAVDHLTLFLTKSPVFFILSARPDIIERRPHLGVTTGDHAVIMLEPLGSEEAVALIERAAGGPVDADLTKAIEQASAGNPLFLVEIVAHLKAQGLVRLHGHEWQPVDALEKIPIAPGVRTQIEVRVASLKADERRVLEACAVQDLTFDAAEIEVASRASMATVLNGLVSLRQSGFIELASGGPAGATSTVDRFRFKHGLIHEAAYEMSSRKNRAEMHERMARWTVDSGRYGDLDERAGHHLESAYRSAVEARTPGDHELRLAREAADHLAKVGRDLAVRGHLPSAAGFFRRSLALYPPRDRGWVNTAIDLAECHVEIGNYREGYAVLDELDRVASELGDPRLQLRAEVSRILIDGATSFADDKQVIDRIDHLIPRLEALGDNTGMSKLRRAQAETHWVRGRCAEAASALELAIYHSWMSPSQRLLPRVVSQMTAVMRWGPIPTSAGIHVCHRLLELTGADPLTEAGVGVRIAALEALRGNFDVARELGARSVAKFHDLGQSQQAASSTQDTGSIELIAGDYEEAARHFKSGLEALTALGVPGFAATNAAFLGRALMALGRHEESLKYLDLAHDLADEDPTLRADTLPVKARIAAELGEQDVALKYLEEARAEAGKTDMLPILIRVELDAATIFARFGMTEDAKRAARNAIDLSVRKEATALMVQAEKLLAEVSAA